MTTPEIAEAPERKSRRIDPEEKKSRVVHAARRLFVQKGFHNVSIPAIVDASGVSTGAIYSYFATKEDLARYIHEETLSEFHARFLQRLEGRESTYEKLRAFAEVVFEAVETDPDVMEYLLFMRHGEFMQGSAPICLTEPFRLVRSIAKEGIERGDLRPGDFFVSGITFTGIILRAAQLRFQCVLEKPLSELAEELIANAWASIKA